MCKDEEDSQISVVVCDSPTIEFLAAPDYFSVELVDETNSKLIEDENGAMWEYGSRQIAQMMIDDDGNETFIIFPTKEMVELPLDWIRKLFAALDKQDEFLERIKEEALKHMKDSDNQGQ